MKAPIPITPPRRPVGVSTGRAVPRGSRGAASDSAVVAASTAGPAIRTFPEDVSPWEAVRLRLVALGDDLRDPEQRQPLVLVAVLTALLMFSYWPGFLNARAAWTSPQYSHGWLVPLFAVALFFWMLFVPGVGALLYLFRYKKPVVDDLVICGRDLGGRSGIADRPTANLGPLGGLNAALHHAVALGFDAVLSAGCDTPLLPAALLDRLRASGEPAFVANLPVVGYWPASLATALDDFLAQDRKHAIRAWAASVSAEAIDWPAIPNVNVPGDLDDLAI